MGFDLLFKGGLDLGISEATVKKPIVIAMRSSCNTIDGWSAVQSRNLWALAISIERAFSGFFPCSRSQSGLG